MDVVLMAWGHFRDLVATQPLPPIRLLCYHERKAQSPFDVPTPKEARAA
jgi:hypothetical protein